MTLNWGCSFMETSFNFPLDEIKQTQVTVDEFGKLKNCRKSARRKITAWWMSLEQHTDCKKSKQREQRWPLSDQEESRRMHQSAWGDNTNALQRSRLWSVCVQCSRSTLVFRVTLFVSQYCFVCMCEKDQRPAVNEKLAAILNLLRAALLLGLSMDKGVFVLGGGGGLVTAESSELPGCSGGSDVVSATAAAATSGSSLTEIAHKCRLS